MCVCMRACVCLMWGWIGTCVCACMHVNVCNACTSLNPVCNQRLKIHEMVMFNKCALNIA